VHNCASRIICYIAERSRGITVAKKFSGDDRPKRKVTLRAKMAEEAKGYAAECSEYWLMV